MGATVASAWQRVLGKDDEDDQVKIAMLGLGGAGKTTALYRLKLGEVVETAPTVGFNVETVDFRSVRFTVWDSDGQDATRRLWHFYFKDARAIAFVVDSGDRGQVDTAREELARVLEHGTMRDMALLVLANKQDLAQAMPVAELTERLGLHSISGRQWLVQPTCAITGDGLHEGLDWLSSVLSLGR